MNINYSGDIMRQVLKFCWWWFAYAVIFILAVVIGTIISSIIYPI